jgi:hypothetical protein
LVHLLGRMYGWDVRITTHGTILTITGDSNTDFDTKR